MQSENILRGFVDTLKAGSVSSANAAGYDMLAISPEACITYNDEVSVYLPYDFGFTAFIHFPSFYSALKKIKDTEYTLIQENDTILLSTAKARIAFQNQMQNNLHSRFFVPYQQAQEGTFLPLPEDFSDILKVAGMSVSKDKINYMLTCVFIEGEDIFGADYSSAFWGKSSIPLEKMAILERHVKVICNMNPVEYMVTKSFYHFRNKDGVIVSVRKIQGDYMDYRPFFDREGDELSFDQEEMLSAIDLGALMIDDPAKTAGVQAPRVKVLVTKGNFFFSGISAKGKSKAKCPVFVNENGKQKKIQEEFSFSIQPSILKECVKKSDTLTLSKDKKILQARMPEGNFIISLV